MAIKRVIPKAQAVQNHLRRVNEEILDLQVSGKPVPAALMAKKTALKAKGK